MNIGFVITTSDPETAWDAFNTASFFLRQGERVTIFLMSEGVEVENLTSRRFDVPGKIKEYQELGGVLQSCKICLERREIDIPRFSTIATLANLHEILRTCDRVLSF